MTKKNPSIKCCCNWHQNKSWNTTERNAAVYMTKIKTAFALPPSGPPALIFATVISRPV